jgi:hypothetical protein
LPPLTFVLYFSCLIKQRLVEYHQALISAVDIGKIDVRDYYHDCAGGHPEEVANASA